MREQRKEDKQIKFRVSEQEYQRLKQNALAFGITVPAYSKMIAQNSKVKPPLIDKQGALEIAAQLRKIGVNINQMALNANTGTAVPKEELQAIQGELGAIWRTLNLGLQNRQTD